MSYKLCKGCDLFKPFSSFGLHKLCKYGRNSRCKLCCTAKSKKEYHQKSYIQKMYERAKTRAAKKKWDFNISISDIVIPDKCPVFGVLMVGDYVPSIDRIDSSKGYVKGNIQVISNRANVLKNNASVGELEQLINYMKTQQQIL